MKFNDKSDKSENSSMELLMNQMQIGIMQVTIIIGHLWSSLILNTVFLNAIVDFFGFFVLKLKNLTFPVVEVSF